MYTAPEERSLRLATGEAVRIRDAAGHAVRCCAGIVCITQQGDSRHIILQAGERFVLDRPGLTTIRALRGVQDVWTARPGIAVIYLSGRYARCCATDARARASHSL